MTGRRIDTVVVGGGQAGLALSHELAQRDVDHIVLDASNRVGDAWRRRWDSLVLFTPRRRDALPGMAFPGDPDGYPGKDEVADYLESYADRFGLPVRTGSPVHRVGPHGDGFVVEAPDAAYRARQVVVATGPFQTPRVPRFATRLAPGVTQRHSSDYHNPAGLPGSRVLVVGAGNTGVQIAAELAVAGRDVALSAGTVGRALPQRVLGRDLFWWLEWLGVMRIRATSRVGRRLRADNPLIGTDPRALFRDVRRLSRAVDAHDDGVALADGTVWTGDAVLWATGFGVSYPWLDVPVLDADGAPIHHQGATRWPGLSFLGLPWQRNRGSALLGWVGEDAALLAARLAAPGRRPAAAAAPAAA